MTAAVRPRPAAVLAILAVWASLLAPASAVAAQQDAGEDSGTYPDTPADAYYAESVALLAERGVFAGTLCDAGFCPGDPIDRKTMAVWVVRVLDGEDPEPVSATRFDDVDGASFYAPFIVRMAELGVTQGCGDGSGFCPDRTVDRAQMAAFLSRAYSLTDGPDPGFTDVADEAWYAADVARLAASAITRGCGDGTRFCPDRDTTRGQMATFLHRAENPDTTEETEQSSDTAVRLNPAMEGGGIIAAGDRWCAVRTDGTITCWEITGSPDPSAPSGQFTAVSAGYGHSCAIVSDGTITCWGSNQSGQTDAPSGQFTAVSAGHDHSCAIVSSESTITCWGSNESGQTDAPSGQFTAVSAGYGHSCAVSSESTITCWGRNHDGQADAPAGRFTAVSAGDAHSCAIRSDGTITCWGAIETASGGVVDTFEPVGQFTAVSSSFNSGQSCAVSTDGTIACWGQNYLGQADAPSGRYVAVSAGPEFSCAVRTDGYITCWGEVNTPLGQTVFTNDVGQPGGQDDAVTPGGEIISAGYGHSCGILADRTVACWGYHDEGQQHFAVFHDLGLHAGQVREVSGMEFVAVSAGSGFASSNSCGLLADLTLTCSGKHNPGPSNRTPAGPFLTVSAGGSHSCGLLAAQTVTCWGSNKHGQRDAPTGRFLAVSAGGFHSCGLLAAQTVTCWGHNHDGQADAPAGGFLAVSAGDEHSCGLRADETIACWGSDVAFDMATQQDYHDGRTSAPAGRFLAVSAGGEHSCGLRADQTVTCWGSNDDGEGDAPAGRFRAVSAGFAHSCGVRADQTVTCWGSNRYGESDAPRLRFLDQTDAAASTSPLIPVAVDCQRQPAATGRPGPPVGVDIARINVLATNGRLGLPAAISWASPCRGGPVDHYVVQWRRGHEDYGAGNQHVVQSASTTEQYSLEIPDVGAYAARVTAANSDGESHSAEVNVPTPANEVRDLLERTVLKYEDRYPWLSEVWTRMNRPDFQAVDSDCGRASSGFKHAGCASSGYVSIVGIRLSSPDPGVQAVLEKSFERTAVHEMAHVYHDLTDLAVNPAAIAAGSMYLNDLIDGSIAGCSTQEMYADIPGILMHADGVTRASATYWSRCKRAGGFDFGWPNNDDRWQELLAVMRSVYVDQEVPQWFYDTYQRADGTWDVDAIKASLGFYDPDARTYRQLGHLIPELAIEVEEEEEEISTSSATDGSLGPRPDISSLIRNATYGSYSLSFLQRSNRPDRCWIAVNGYLYDVTPGEDGYNYPGPGQITDLCGQDATDHFVSNLLTYPPLEYLKGYLRSS